jgi:hypothetical protein
MRIYACASDFPLSGARGNPQHTVPSLRQSNARVRQRYFFMALHGRLGYYRC